MVSRPIPRIRRATQAQDGHSFGEQALYEALWQSAHPHGPDTRIITIGYRRMAELARLTVNNCKANIQALIRKLAVDEIASFTHSQGRTYLVYSHGAIIQRRRAAGLTHYIKSRGVAFVDPDTGEALAGRLRDRSGVPFSGAPGMGVPEGGFGGAPAGSGAVGSGAVGSGAVGSGGAASGAAGPGAGAAGSAAVAERLREAEDQMRQMRREFQAILEDPGSSEEDRRFVRQMLEGK